MTVEEFLRDIPPTKSAIVACNIIPNSRIQGTFNIQLSELFMHCDECEGERYFTGKYSEQLYLNSNQNIYIHFTCKNCSRYKKVYAVAVKITSTERCEIYKYGEQPSFGPPTPSKVFNLIGDDRGLYLIGRRAESQGMGIGAFTYYRRVLENQKNRIIDEIIKVLLKYDSEQNIVDQFEKAKVETQFSKAIEAIKDTLPKILFIDNHNPLNLLHTALSNGIHSQNDEECLELATSIRVLLFELSERINVVLKEKKELKEAVSKLLKPKK